MGQCGGQIKRKKVVYGLERTILDEGGIAVVDADVKEKRKKVAVRKLMTVWSLRSNGGTERLATATTPRTSTCDVISKVLRVRPIIYFTSIPHCS